MTQYPWNDVPDEDLEFSDYGREHGPGVVALWLWVASGMMLFDACVLWLLLFCCKVI